MPPSFRLLLAAAFLVSITGCQVVSRLKHRQSSKDQPEASEDLKAIGTVEMVNPEAGFVIVHTLANVPISPGTELTVVTSTGENAKIKVTPERKSIFITADVLSGNPSKGDTVFSGPGPEPAAVAAVATPQQGGVPAPVSGIPEANLLRSAPALPGSQPAAAPAAPLALPTPRQEEFLRVVPPGAPR